MFQVFQNKQHIYVLNLFKVNHEDTKKKSFGLVLVSSLLTLNIASKLTYWFHYWLWISQLWIKIGLIKWNNVGLSDLHNNIMNGSKEIKVFLNASTVFIKMLVVLKNTWKKGLTSTLRYCGKLVERKIPLFKIKTLTN